MRKRAWVALIAATFVLGAAAWAVARYLARPRRIAMYSASEALARHPASRARQADPHHQGTPVGPDDDPEFLRRLAERIRDGY